jgi:hypothetical protein
VKGRRHQGEGKEKRERGKRRGEMRESRAGKGFVERREKWEIKERGKG